MDENAERDRILAVKAKYEDQLLRKRNVVGVGIGLRQRDGKWTDEMVLTVLVRRRWPWPALLARNRIPRRHLTVMVHPLMIHPLAQLRFSIGRGRLRRGVSRQGTRLDD